MGLPSPEEVSAMMAAEGVSSSRSSLPSPDQVQQMMDAERPADSPGMAALKTFTGGIANIVSGIPFGDEAIAGASAIPTALLTGEGLGESYDSNLALTRQLIADYNKEAGPVVGIGSQIAGGLAMPRLFNTRAVEGPLASKAAYTVDAVKRLTKEGAALGGLYGFAGGEGGVGNRVQGATTGALLGGGISAAIAGPLTVAGDYGPALLNKLRQSIMPSAAESAQSADDIARQALGQHTDLTKLSTAIANAPASPYSQYMRTAEVASDPGLALFTKVLEKQNPTAGVIGGAVDDLRDVARMGDYTAVQGPVLTAEQVGAKLRPGLEEANTAIGERVGKAYQAAAKGRGTVPLFDAKVTAADAIAAVKSQGRSIDNDTMAVVRNFQKIPNNASVSEMTFQRQTIGKLIGDIRSNPSATPQQKAGLAVLSKLFGAIDDAEKLAVTQAASGTTKSGIQKGISATQQQALEKGRQLRALQGDLFQDMATGDILRKDQFGRYNVLNSDVLGKVIASPEEARQVMQALAVRTAKGGTVAGKKNAEEAVRSGLLEELKTRATNPQTNAFEPGRFSRSWRNMKSAAKEVLTPQQMKAVEQVRTDLLRRSSYDRMASSASKGQSVTAQHTGAAAFVKSMITDAARSKTGIIGKLFSGIGDAQAAKITGMVDQILIDFAFDPAYAVKFLNNKPTRAMVQSISTDVVNRAMNTITKVAAPAMAPKDKAHAARARSELAAPQIIAARALTQAKPASDATIRSFDREYSVNRPKEEAKTVIVDDPAHRAVLNQIADAVTTQESGGNVKAVSDKGAQGLMQLMPATGKELFHKYRSELPSDASPKEYDPFNKKQNRELGTRYLAELIDKYKGDLELALTAYHSGPGRVDKLLEQEDGSKLSDIIDYLGPVGQKYARQVLARLNSQKTVKPKTLET